MDLHDRHFGALPIDVLVEGEQTRLTRPDELDESRHALALGLVGARLEPVRGDEDERAGHRSPLVFAAAPRNPIAWLIAAPEPLVLRRALSIAKSWTTLVAAPASRRSRPRAARHSEQRLRRRVDERRRRRGICSGRGGRAESIAQ